VEKLSTALHLIELMNKMLRSYDALVSRVMAQTMTPTSVQEIEEYIKLFLSCFLHMENACDAYTTSNSTQEEGVEQNQPRNKGETSGARTPKTKKKNQKEKERKNISTANHLSMLNIPSTIGQFGTIRDFWDGNDEKLVQKLKPRCKSMRKEGSQRWKPVVLNHVTQSQTLGIITGYAKHNVTEEGCSKFVYNSKNKIEQEVANGRPLLITKIKDQPRLLFCLFKMEAGMVGRIEINPRSDFKIVVGGVVHVVINLIETVHFFAEDLCVDKIITTGMIIPERMRGQEMFQQYWHIFDFDWNVFKNKEMAWPGIW
jgi:hypothetical protein